MSWEIMNAINMPEETKKPIYLRRNLQVMLESSEFLLSFPHGWEASTRNWLGW